MFAESLQKLLELKEDKKFSELFITSDNGKTSINKEKFNELKGDDRITLYKYLMYLYAGALAIEVNKKMNKTISKGLNYDILKMSNKDFKNFLQTHEPLMNNSVVFKHGANVDTPIEIFNKAINGMKEQMLRSKDKILEKIILNLKENIFLIQTATEGIYYPKFPRFYFNIKRGLKKLFGCQDFSYASKEYKEIFENIFNTLDSTKESNKIKK